MSKETEIRAHQYLYYVLGTPVITDREYDYMCRLCGIEGSGGSDLESSYSDEEKSAAISMLNRRHN